MITHRNNPHRYRISFWHWGTRIECYQGLKKSPRWVRNKGQLGDPCDVAGCKRWIETGEWYVRHPFLGVVCSTCAPKFGATPPTENA